MCDSIVVWNVDMLPSGVGQAGTRQLQVWPNPFSEKLLLETNQPLLSIEIKDCLGHSVPVSSEIENNHVVQANISFQQQNYKQEFILYLSKHLPKHLPQSNWSSTDTNFLQLKAAV